MIKESKNSTLGVYTNVDVKPFYKCNAYERYCYNNLGLLDCIEFVSYCTPIAVLKPNCYIIDSIIYVSNACTCSAATRKQFGRWLHEHRNEVNTCYMSVKHELERARKIYSTHTIVELNGKGDLVQSFNGNNIESVQPFFNCRYDSIKSFNAWC